ncbi:MAG TPA: preprotein translocase subunit SecG [Candidatus Paceibacterota bacterium]
MNVSQILSYSQIGLALLLVLSILLQQRGSGLSGALGGSTLEYSTKRGAEKVIFYLTIVFAILFIAVSIARVIIA